MRSAKRIAVVNVGYAVCTYGCDTL